MDFSYVFLLDWRKYKIDHEHSYLVLIWRLTNIQVGWISLEEIPCRGATMCALLVQANAESAILAAGMERAFGGKKLLNQQSISLFAKIAIESFERS